MLLGLPSLYFVVSRCLFDTVLSSVCFSLSSNRPFIGLLSVMSLVCLVPCPLGRVVVSSLVTSALVFNF